MPVPPTEGRISLDELVPRLRCPLGGGGLRRVGDTLVSDDGGHVHPIVRGVPQLMHPPERLRIEQPWLEPWEELDRMTFERPLPSASKDLPYHLDAHLASVPGEVGGGRWILEVGCGERLCEPYFASRGFRYVGVDADCRGIGPHVTVDAHNLPFADASFDMYLSLAVYEHLACPLQAAIEAFRVVKPGGKFFGTAAFVYGFHDRASFHHMTHAGLLWTIRMAGFRDVRIWPDWSYTTAIPEMAFGPGAKGAPWRIATRAWLKAMDVSFTLASKFARRLTGHKAMDLRAREVHTASSLSFVATKPA